MCQDVVAHASCWRRFGSTCPIDLLHRGDAPIDVENAVNRRLISACQLCHDHIGKAAIAVDDFARIRLYRKRAAEFQCLADNASIPTVQRRYRAIARHYSELADREEQADKTRMAERLTQLRRQREEAAHQAVTPIYLMAADNRLCKAPLVLHRPHCRIPDCKVAAAVKPCEKTPATWRYSPQSAAPSRMNASGQPPMVV